MGKNDKKIRIFSALEIANICGVVNQTTINWIKNGYLKAFITPGGQYRVYAEDLIEFLESRGMRIPEVLLEPGETRVDWDTLIIVDDDEELNNVVKKFIQKKMPELTLFQAFDGFEAGKLISKYKPGIIILDIRLPGIDGHKLCKDIKSDPTFGNPVVIAVTGFEEAEGKETIMGEGADAYFAKPFDFSKLVSEIKKLVKKYKESEKEA
ncbi:MAG: response regulator [Spirochaetales bacterium]|nr:response regulator [Spirochaetales bacterium]